MSASKAVVTLAANSEPFRKALVELLNGMAPLLWRISLMQQRRRSRLVTRNKQRRKW